MSLIVEPWRLVIRITPRAVPLLALVTALSAGCNTRSSPDPPAAVEPGPHQEHSSGSERGLPDVQTYARRLEESSRDAWQRPEEVIELLECRPGMTAVALGAGTAYFLRSLSAAVGDEGHVIPLDLATSTVDLLLTRVEREELRNVHPAVVTPDDPALAARSVDRILVANTWHHI